MKRIVRSVICGSMVSLLASACSSGGMQGGEDPPVVETPPPPEPDTTPTPAPKAAALPPALSGGTLSVFGKTAIASDPDRDQIYVVDLPTRSLRHTIPLKPGDEPGRQAQDAAGMVHVALRHGGALLAFDPQTGNVLSRRELCGAPRGITFDGRRNLLHVACADGQLISIAPAAMEPARTLQLERDLRDVVVKGDVLFVSTFRQANVIAVDAGTGSVTGRGQPIKTRAAFLSGFGGKVPFSPSGSPGSILSASPAVAWRMVAGPSGNPVVIHQRGLDGEVGTQPGGYGNGQSCAGIMESAITEINTATPSAQRSTKALTNTVLPVDIAISPRGGQMAFVAAGQAEHKVQFMAVGDDAALAQDVAATGNQVNPNGTVDCVKPSPIPLPEPEVPTDGADEALPEPIEFRAANGDVVAVAFDGKGNVLVQSRNPANLQILTQRGEPIVLSQQPRYDAGHALFHHATPGQIACASCHPEGGEDSRAWRFAGLGERRTQSLRGGIMDTAPFHWDGLLRDMDHLMADVFQQRMGGGQVSATQIGALTGWIDSIPRVDLKGRADAEAVARGKALFYSAEVGCSSCHAGSKHTNNKLADVGTGGVLQTPQLVDLALRAPYMHNGCAKTLKERFSGACGGDDRHGVTSKLSPAQIDDLVGYLETL